MRPSPLAVSPALPRRSLVGRQPGPAASEVALCPRAFDPRPRSRVSQRCNAARLHLPAIPHSWRLRGCKWLSRCIHCGARDLSHWRVAFRCVAWWRGVLSVPSSPLTDLPRCHRRPAYVLGAEGGYGGASPVQGSSVVAVLWAWMIDCAWSRPDRCGVLRLSNRSGGRLFLLLYSWMAAVLLHE